MARKKRNDYNNYRTGLMIAVAVFFICALAYSTCVEQNHNDRLSQLSGDAELQKLTEVKTVNTDDGELLHYPGFDVFFSNKHRQPYYSTWILTPEHAAATDFSRSNNFRPDPNVANSAQLADYKYSGYDRGHMAPSADFRYDKEAQDATFYLTNMSPQQNALNAKAWANLEDQCRAWALRDSTIVIVAGPILSDYLTETIGESKVTVPSRYFKVIYAPYANPPRAIGFIMPNGYVEGGVQQTACTVDEVEAITGFDFFSALPDELENEIESVAKYSQWQYPKKRKTK